jgi:hypothetical protein
MSEIFHSIIGLPNSGKTTFLAALWHLIDSGEVSSKLTLDRLEGDHTYLNDIVDAWRKCEEVPRTPLEAETRVAIHVREPASGHQAVISFPDLSGESFELQVATRTCHSTYVENCNSSGGILLFVTANRAIEGVTIVELGPLVGGEDDAPPVVETQEWDSKKMPDQARVVELLQFLQRSPFALVRRRLVIIVSAWDVVPDGATLAPIDWIEREMPLLHQFLVTNKNSFDARAFGVSAQGGIVKGEGEARKALLEKTPSERITLAGGDSRHDLTEPIIWLMRGE